MKLRFDTVQLFTVRFNIIFIFIFNFSHVFRHLVWFYKMRETGYLILFFKTTSFNYFGFYMDIGYCRFVDYQVSLYAFF